MQLDMFFFHYFSEQAPEDNDLSQPERPNSPLPDHGETSHPDQTDIHKLASPQG